MEPDRKVIKQYFLKNDIRFVQLYDNDNSLMIWYEKNGPKYKKKSEWTAAEKETQSYLNKTGKNLTRTEVNNWTDVEISNQPKTSSNSTSWPLIIGLFIIGIIFLGGLIIFLRAKKRKSLRW